MVLRPPDILGGDRAFYCARRWRLSDEADDLGSGDDQNLEHQMTHHLRGSAHLDGSAAVIVFEVGVDPFGAAALVVSDTPYGARNTVVAGSGPTRAASTRWAASSAKRGARLLRAWALGSDVARPSTAAVLGLLLTPYRAPAPPEPWELARALAAGFRVRRDDLFRPRARIALSRVVPEYDGAVAIQERRLPESATDLCVVRAVEWQAVAIGVARVIQNPDEAALDILRSCDDHGLRRIEAGLSQWPLEMRIVVADRFARPLRTSGRRKGPRGAWSGNGETKSPRCSNSA